MRRVLKRRTTLLCIDDQAAVLPVRKTFLESQGYEVFTAASGREGLEILRQRPIDAVLVDYRMPKMDGGEVAREIRRTRTGMPIIMLSGFPQEIPSGIRDLVDALVLKGDNLTVLLENLHALVPQRRIKPRAAKPNAETQALPRDLRRSSSARRNSRRRPASS
jgi:CheY-like chemotaxis protein